MEKSPEELKADVKAQLAWDTRVDARDIDIEIFDGRVILSGVVSNYPARNAAEIDANLVKGVKEVENDVSISIPPSTKIPTDEDIRVNAETSLLLNNIVNAEKIDVKVSNGMITLEGVQDSYHKKIKAMKVVSDIAGVIDVKDNIAIVPSETISDELVAESIIKAFDQMIFVEPDEINLKVNKGVVTVSGIVTDRKEYNAVLDTIRYTRGVIEIVNLLTIKLL